MRETWVPFLGREDALEKGETTHSSILTWRIPWTSPWGCKESDTTEQLSLHFIKSINNSDYSYTQTGEDTTGQRPSGRRASPPHPPLGFSPAPSRSTSTGDPSPPAQTPPPLSRGPACPPPAKRCNRALHGGPEDRRQGRAERLELDQTGLRLRTPGVGMSV